LMGDLRRQNVCQALLLCFLTGTVACHSKYCSNFFKMHLKTPRRQSLGSTYEYHWKELSINRQSKKGTWSISGLYLLILISPCTTQFIIFKIPVKVDLDNIQPLFYLYSISIFVTWFKKRKDLKDNEIQST
jgi:hypothetical protein